MEKRAEITTQKIVFLIILITSFAIILFLLFRLNIGETSNKEICHNSVILKSKGGVFTGKLDCKVNYLCISGGGKCEDISPTATVKVDLNNKEEIMKAIADEMVDCWWMFGEGELDYMGGSFLGNTACAVCSIVKFDKKIQEEYPEGITYEEFLNNLSKSMNEKETYLHYLYDVYTIDEFIKKFEAIKTDYDSKTISLEEKYMIRTGQVQEWVGGSLWKWIAGDEEVNNLVPYFFNVNEIPNPQCDEFITKA